MAEPREKILVTGSSGLVGSALIRSLTPEFDLIALDREGPPHPPREADWVFIDLTSDESVQNAFTHVRLYNGARIAHMVTLLHADDEFFVVLDNNYIHSYEWCTPAEFQRAYTSGGGGWAVILLDAGPPPMPEN